MSNYINHLKGLDILRFILSFSIILWHYQHFFYPFVTADHPEVYLTRQPFYTCFSLFYRYGNYAVQFFWLVSGIIFYKIYHEKIAAGAISIKTFFVKRFSRLYPLHFATLVLVLILQQLSLRLRGEYFIYPQNTGQDFFLNLLFIQSWGVNKFSFNGPAWSVSIEIMAYLIFFVLAFSNLINTNRSLIITFLIFAILKKWQLVFLTADMGDCVYFFFLGCLFIKTYERIRGNTGKQLLALFILLVIWLISFYNSGRPKNLYHVLSGFLDIDIMSLSMLVVLAFLMFFNLPVFNKVNSRVFSVLGNMTYSTYLIHFPVQLILVLTLKPANYTIFFSAGFFFTYLFSTLVLGFLIYEFFELPVQARLRKRSPAGS